MKAGRVVWNCAFKILLHVIDAVVIRVAVAIIRIDRREVSQFPCVRQAVAVVIVRLGVLAVHVEHKVLRQRGVIGDQQEITIARQPRPRGVIELLVEGRVRCAAGRPVILRGFWNRALFEVEPDGTGIGEAADPPARVGGHIHAAFQGSVGRDDVGDASVVERHDIGIVYGAAVGGATDREGRIVHGAETEIVSVAGAQRRTS